MVRGGLKTAVVVLPGVPGGGGLGCACVRMQVGSGVIELGVKLCVFGLPFGRSSLPLEPKGTSHFVLIFWTIETTTNKTCLC